MIGEEICFIYAIISCVMEFGVDAPAVTPTFPTSLNQSDFIMELEKIQSNLENLLKTGISESGEIISKFHSIWQELESIKEKSFISNCHNGGLSTIENSQ